MMTVSEWVDHWVRQAPSIPPGRLRDLIDSITEDESEEDE